jgi:hypothetical protein
MKIFRAIFYRLVFFLQVMLYIVLYVYSAHYWPLLTTFSIAVGETLLLMWSYNRLFPKKKNKSGLVKKMHPKDGNLNMANNKRKNVPQ